MGEHPWSLGPPAQFNDLMESSRFNVLGLALGLARVSSSWAPYTVGVSRAAQYAKALTPADLNTQFEPPDHHTPTIHNKIRNCLRHGVFGVSHGVFGPILSGT